MHTAALLPPPGLPLPPADLSRGQQAVLVALAVLAHAGVAALASGSSPAVRVMAERPPIEVSLIDGLPDSVHSPAPQAVPPPKPSQPAHAAPSPPPVQSRTPPPAAPPVLATARATPSSNEMQAQREPPAANRAAAAPAPTNTPAVALPAPNQAANASPAQADTANSAEPARPAAPRQMASSAVRYLVAPVLRYPQVSRDMGESGAVVLKVLVDERGRPKQIELIKSSGFPRLDQQARQAMAAARFQPLIEDGQAREAWVTPGPLIFNLEEQ
jgi:protein TonB